MTLLIYASGLNSAGGLNVGISITSNLCMNYPYDNFILICSNNSNYAVLDYPNLQKRMIPKVLDKNFMRILFSYWVKRCISEVSPDVIFNLSNLPLRTKAKQLVMLHWPYAVYPESEVWKKMRFLPYLKRKIKLFTFKNNIRFASRFTVQTNVMKNRLESLYKLNNIDVVSSSVSFADKENISDNKKVNELKKISSFKFLYLTRYYPHKNVEVLLDVAEKIKELNLDFKIILTLDANQNIETTKINNYINDKKLENVLINIGTVSFEDVKSLYFNVDALIMPTLLESFGLPFLEAMYFNKPIFTSNLDFAIEVCKDSAFYFDPFDPHDILDKIKLIENQNMINTKLILAKKILLDKYVDWSEISINYYKILNNMIEDVI